MQGLLAQVKGPCYFWGSGLPDFQPVQHGFFPGKTVTRKLSTGPFRSGGVNWVISMLSLSRSWHLIRMASDAGKIVFSPAIELTFLYGALISVYVLRGILLNQAKEISVMTEKKEKKEKKDYCDATDQRKIVEKMTDCDKSSSTDKDLTECYTKIIEEDEGCMS